MTLQHWDTMIAPQLAAIRNSAEWIKHYANEAERAVEMLPERPGFETVAEAVLSEAEVELMVALKRVRQAKGVYAGKPVEAPAEQELVI